MQGICTSWRPEAIKGQGNFICTQKVNLVGSEWASITHTVSAQTTEVTMDRQPRPTQAYEVTALKHKKPRVHKSASIKIKSSSQTVYSICSEHDAGTKLFLYRLVLQAGTLNLLPDGSNWNSPFRWWYTSFRTELPNPCSCLAYRGAGESKGSTTSLLAHFTIWSSPFLFFTFKFPNQFHGMQHDYHKNSQICYIPEKICNMSIITFDCLTQIYTYIQILLFCLIFWPFALYFRDML